MNQKLKIAAAALGGIVATVAAGGIAFAAMGPPPGHFARADANNDGQVTSAEWMQAAKTRFDALDANKDGKLVATELPRKGPGRHGGHGHRDHHRDHGPDAPPPAPAPSAAPANITAPAQ